MYIFANKFYTFYFAYKKDVGIQTYIFINYLTDINLSFSFTEPLVIDSTSL